MEATTAASAGSTSNPLSGGLAGVANGGRVTVAEVVPDGREAETGMQTGQVHGQVASLRNHGLPTRAAKGRSPHAELFTDSPGNLLDREPGRGECVILGQKPGHGAEIKHERLARSRLLEWLASLIGVPPVAHPHFQSKASKPAVHRTVTISSLRQGFHGLGRERQTSHACSLMQKSST